MTEQEIRDHIMDIVIKKFTPRCAEITDDQMIQVKILNAMIDALDEGRKLTVELYDGRLQ